MLCPGLVLGCVGMGVERRRGLQTEKGCFNVSAGWGGVRVICGKSLDRGDQRRDLVLVCSGMDLPWESVSGSCGASHDHDAQPSCHERFKLQQLCVTLLGLIPKSVVGSFLFDPATQTIICNSQVCS